MRHFNANTIRETIRPHELIPTLRQHFIALAEERAQNSSRLVMPLAGTAAIGAMLSQSNIDELLGAKLVVVRPENIALGLNPHQGVVALFSARTGQVIATFDAAEITGLRTAALSAAATEVLSDPEAHTLAIFGTGLQAYLHAVAIVKIRQIRKIQIYGRSIAKALQLRQRLTRELNISVTPYASVREAARDADILCLCTASTTAYLSLEDIQPGAHINAIGACRPGMREIDLSASTKIKIYVDDHMRIREEASELENIFTIFPIGNAFTKPQVAENYKDTTLFKSVGVGLQDIATAAYILKVLG